MTEDVMVGSHHRFNGHGFGWTLGVGDGQGGLVCCSPWGHKESDTTERLNRLTILLILSVFPPHYVFKTLVCKKKTKNRITNGVFLKPAHPQKVSVPDP